MRAEIRKVSSSNNPKEILPNWLDLEYLDDSTDVGTVVFTYPSELAGYDLVEDGGEYALFVDGKELPNGRFILDETDGNEVDDTGPKYKWSGQTTLSVFEEAIILPKKDNQAKLDVITKSEQRRYEEAAKEWMGDERKDLRKDLKGISKEIRDDAKEHYKGEKPDHLKTEKQVSHAITEAKKKEQREWKKQHDTDEDGSVDWRDFDPSGKLGHDLEGAPPPEKPSFNNATPGEVLGWAIREAKQRGCFPKVKLGFTDKRDSNGHKWEERITTKIEVGGTILDFIRWMTERGKAEARMHGWRIDLYNRESGVDRSDPRVLIARGYNITDAPRQASSRDRVSSVYVMSQNGVHGYIRDRDLTQQMGVKEASFTVEDVEEWGEADSQGRAYLEKQGRTREQHTYGVAPNTGADPYKNFDMADWIYVMLKKTAEKQRVRQITLSWSNDKSDGEIKLVLNDVITERRIAHERMLKNQGGRSTLTKRAGLGPHHTRRQPDGISPKKPSTPRVESRNGVVRVFYDGKDVDGNDPVYDEHHVEVHQGDNPDFDVDTVYGTTLVSNFNSPGVAVLTNEDYGTETFFKLVSVDEGGDRSEPSDAASAIVQQVTPDDVTWDPTATPPIVPVQPTVAPPAPSVTGMKGAMAVRWDGIENATFVQYQVHMSIDPLFVPVFDDPTTLLQNTAGNFVTANRLPPMPGTELSYFQADGTTKQLYFFRVIPFNEAGPGPVSGTGAGSMDQTALGDIVADAILTELLTALNVRAQDLIIGSETGRSIILNITSGLTINSQAGQPLFAAPITEGEELSINAKAVLSTLDVMGGMSVFGPNNKLPGTLTMSNGVAPPVAKPTAAVDVENLAYEKPSGNGEFYGLSYSAANDRYYTCWVPDNGTPQMLTYNIAGDILFAFNVSNTWRPRGGCVYHPGIDKLVLLCNTDAARDDYQMELRNLDGTLVNRDAYQFLYSDVTVPALGWDWVNSRILMASTDHGGSGGISAHQVTAAGVWTHNIASQFYNAGQGPMDDECGGVVRIPAAGAGFDLGADRFIIHGRGSASTNKPFYAFDPSVSPMARDTSREWLSDGNWVAGFCWNPDLARFVSTAGGSANRKTWQGLGNTWVGNASETWTAQTTFYRSTTGPYETAASPAVSFTMNKRWRVQVTAASAPNYGGSIDPEYVRLYLAKTVPSLPTLRYQAQAASGKFTLTNSNFASASPLPSSPFPLTAPGKFKSDTTTDGTVVELDGSGYARIDMVMPIGSGIPVFHNVVAGSEPRGWLVGDGREIAGGASTYPVLAAKWGSGASCIHGTCAAGNIRVPDTRDRFLVGAGDGTMPSRSVGQTEGEVNGNVRYDRHRHDHTHSIQLSANHSHGGPSHSHAGPSHDHGAGSLASASASNTTATGGANRALNPITGTTGLGGAAQTGNAGTAQTTNDGAHDHSGVTGNESPDGDAHPRIGVVWLIRAA